MYGGPKGPVLFLSCVLCSIFALCSCSGAAHGSVTVRFLDSTRKEVASFSVEVADTPGKRRQGLMFRKQLEEGTGMLFVFDKDEPRSFWMKNTYIPLDIVFIGESQEVVSVVEGTTPLSTEPVRSAGPAKYVLEVNAGEFSERGLAPSMTVEIEGY